MSYFVLLGTFLLATLLHELGHVAGAKLVRIQVRTLSIGFGPVLARTTYRGVTYQLCLLLLGGYVLPSDVAVSRTRRIVFIASGLIMSIVFVPLACLAALPITDPTVSFTDGWHRLMTPWLTHPLDFLFDSLPLLLPDGPYTVTVLLQSLAATSLFLGLANCLPLIMLDGGQLLLLLFEGLFPGLRQQERKLLKISYVLLGLLIAVPILIVFVQHLETTYPILLVGAFVLYRVVKLSPRARL
ncbi:site-2 protease family protein [Exiguobacterium sp. s193]|uniref:site-2 protease family protein n=1 Tax=Exiguobacterium sp. s193 TaxID=2751207 RepID=UPI001BE4EC0D|nr:site-2 protease family protein [Exiguobacterium sp. s193]